MFGRIEADSLLLIAIVTIGAVAVATDLLRGKIYNAWTLPALLGGILYSGVSGGLAGAGLALAGACVGLLCFGGLFATRVMGGGDVKLLVALGAWLGPQRTMECAALSIFVGGAMALVLLLLQGRLGGFAKRVYGSARSVVIPELVFESPRVDRRNRMPFAPPIAIAAAWVVAANPFAGVLKGWLPW